MDAVFLQAIVDAPGDLLARRAYADWLMEHPDTDPREAGEFTSRQLELAGRVRPPARRRAMERRVAELLAWHEAAWLVPFRGMLRSHHFRRGFVERISIHATTLPHAEELFAA